MTTLQNVTVVRAALDLGDEEVETTTVFIDEQGRFCAEEVEGAQRIDCSGQYLMPAFVDLQVNDYPFFSRPEAPSHEEVLERLREIVDRQVEEGVAAFLLATVASPVPRLLDFLRAAGKFPKDRLVGIMVEGLYMNKACKGCHQAAFLKDPDLALTDQLIDTGAVSVLNVAPELPGALDVIKRSVSRGIKVAFGHSLATGDQIRAAQEAGMSYCIHLGNGNTGSNRHGSVQSSFKPHLGGGMLEEALRNDNIMATVICDSFHIFGGYVRDWIVTKELRRFVAITDRGFSFDIPDDFEVFGIHGHKEGQVLLTGKRGEIDPATPPALFGSAARMIDCANNLLLWLTCPMQGVYVRQHPALSTNQALSAIVAACCRNPALVLGRPDLGVVAIGECANAFLARVDESGITITQRFFKQ